MEIPISLANERGLTGALHPQDPNLAYYRGAV